MKKLIVAALALLGAISVAGFAYGKFHPETD